MRYKITLMIMLIICTCTALAQPSTPDPGIQLLKKMAGRYSQPGSISFNMQFRYAAESAPGTYLDSLDGSASISGNQYTYTLGNTRLIRTNEYMISIFSEEKIIQLIKLNTTDNSSPMETAGVSNTMIKALDSLQQSGLVKISTASAAGQHIITVAFINHPSWKSAQYVIRTQDDFLEKTVIVTKMEEMLGAGLQGQNLADGYAIVETIFSNYTSREPDPGTWQAARYFIRKGEEFEPTAGYKDYRVMLVQ